MRTRLLLIGVLCSVAAPAQTRAIEAYLRGAQADALAAASPGSRDRRAMQNLLPHVRSNSFVEFVRAKSSTVTFSTLLDSLEALRLNKLVGSGAGATGVTSLVSRVAVPAVLGFGVEYGGILQQNNGAVSTLRANLLGLARMAVGSEQFPYCPEIEQEHCSPPSRWLRRFSASLSFENVRARTDAVAATPANAAPVVTDLFGNEFRMAAWGARFDLTGSQNLDDPKHVTAWKGAVDKLRSDPSALKVTEAVDDLFSKVLDNEVYTTWMAETVAVLQSAPTADDFRRRLEERLDLLITRMSEADPDFAGKISALRRAYSNYFSVRDGLLRELHRHKLSVEYTNQHPQNQLYSSNTRVIYSHQPTESPTLVTVNAGFTFYNSLPSGVKSGRLRDVQLAGQLDHRLGQIPRFGHAVLAVAGYYQWMKEDAVIRIGPGNVTPGSGIVLPGTAATLLGTKGHIGVVQGKVAIPISGVLKIPVSVTWANRSELIKENDLRGQVGLTLDLDSLFH